MRRTDFICASLYDLYSKVTGAARAIADDDTSEPAIALRKALQDTVRRHELQIVVVSTNAEVRRARQRGLERELIRDEDFGARLAQLHGDLSALAGR